MILLVAGTRPEVIKLAPVRAALDKAGVPSEWMWTGQQPDLCTDAFEAFGMEPEYKLIMDRKTGSLSELQAILANLANEAMEQLKPEVVVVQGDTLSAAVFAQAAFLAGIKVAHVEAGLRSWDTTQPFPEEACRVWIDAIADYKFAPTSLAARTLSGNVWVTGNTVVDAVHMVKREIVLGGRYLVVTMHRRENMDHIRDVCEIVADLSTSGCFERIIWPVHPNPEIRNRVNQMIKGYPKISLVAPLPYAQMVNVVRTAEAVLTDSGGLQEECLALHVPCFVMRETTERPEGVAAGGARLVGTDRKRIYGWMVWTLLHDRTARQEMVDAKNPYGDGRAASRIAMVLRSALSGRQPHSKLASWSGG